jgi:hypothetical protein
MNTNELNARQIARIARIRKERKEKLRLMNHCHWCCDKTPADKLVALIDGRHMCVDCMEDYNDSHADTSYDECDGCGLGYLCKYGSGMGEYADQYCPACDLLPAKVMMMFLGHLKVVVDFETIQDCHEYVPVRECPSV